MTARTVALPKLPRSTNTTVVAIRLATIVRSITRTCEM
jgi:hypothetical protein